MMYQQCTEPYYGRLSEVHIKFVLQKNGFPVIRFKLIHSQVLITVFF